MPHSGNSWQQFVEGLSEVAVSHIPVSGLPTIRPELIKGLGCQNISACSVAAINEQHRSGYVRGSVRSKKDDRSHNLGEAGTTT